MSNTEAVTPRDALRSLNIIRWRIRERLQINFETHAKLKLFMALFFFGLGISSLWLGLTTSPEVVRITAWYIGAIVFAILGIVVLKLPTAKQN
jgi:ATP/ADP translocase